MKKMCFPSEKKFCQLKTEAYISIYKEIPMGILNPLAIYEELEPKINSFILESVQRHKKTGRYSLIGFNPYMIFKSKNNYIEITRPGKSIIKKKGNPLKELQNLISKRKTLNLNNIPFHGGAAGYFSYDVMRFFEDIPLIKPDSLSLPDCYFIFVDSAIIFDHFRKKILLVKNTKINIPKKKSYYEAIKSIKKIEEIIVKAKKKLRNNEHAIHNKNAKGHENKNRNNCILYHPVSNYTENDYISMVEKVKEYISAGDIFQANLSQRFSTEFKGDPYKLYKMLREINPSPFACFFNFQDVQVVSSSPERLVKLENKKIETRPIAGTRPRRYNKTDDYKLSAELLLNPKERAEHIMLVDLERNDLGRVCEYGSVKVDELMVLEKYSHVIHIVSNIKGKLKKDKTWLDVLRAMFPGGTITGTPKIRCMEIIEELENVGRSLYTGSAGYLSFSGDMDLNILIRTIIIKQGKAYIQAGGGIVADSIPEKEYHETLYKAEALLKALRDYAFINP
ncbi:anthranilate synthase component I [Candidatus Desantisbacteria bacterium]|nr:anthranilate synthase component I [Candidatus Desantisbacteria bacterium]